MSPLVRRLLLGAALVLAAGEARAQGEVPGDSVARVAERSRWRGAEDAPVTLYVFSDFQCPYCRQFEREAYRALDSAYVAKGWLRLAFVNFPLSTHGRAWVAAEAALCAGVQGKFWPMHDRLFADQPAWSGPDASAERFTGYARELGLEIPAFEACTREDRVATVLIQDLTSAAQAGVRGTPAFLFVRSPAEGENPQDASRAFTGPRPFAEFRAVLEELLNGRD